MALLASPLALISSVPPVTRSFTVATIIFSLLYAWLRWKEADSLPYLTLVPGSSLFYPWTFVASALVETSIIELLLTIITIPLALRYLERLWGSIEILKFIAVTVGFSNLIAFAFNWIEFAATRNDLFLYGMQYHGQMSLQIAVLVAFTQLIPEHQVQFMGVLKTRIKNLPMVYLTISTIMTILGFQCPWIIIQFGWYVSWVYLRFYKKSSADTAGGIDTYGDRSETFSLVSWFPPFLHGPLSVLGNTVHSVASRFHLIPSVSNDLETGSYSQAPGSARAEAERRRAMALKALDQRLANGPSALGTNVVTAPSPRQPNTPVSGPDVPSSSTKNGDTEPSNSSESKDNR